MRTSGGRRGLASDAVPGGLSIFTDFGRFLSGYKFRRSCRCRRPRRPPRLFQRCRFAVPFGPKTLYKVCSFQHNGRSQQLPHPHKTTWSSHCRIRWEPFSHLQSNLTALRTLQNSIALCKLFMLRIRTNHG